MNKLYENRFNLTREQMQEIHDDYEIFCTAEYLIENYHVLNENKAIALASDIRRCMDKYDYTEKKAIEEVLETA